MELKVYQEYILNLLEKCNTNHFETYLNLNIFNCKNNHVFLNQDFKLQDIPIELIGKKIIQFAKFNTRMEVTIKTNIVEVYLLKRTKEIVKEEVYVDRSLISFEAFIVFLYDLLNKYATDYSKELRHPDKNTSYILDVLNLKQNDIPRYIKLEFKSDYSLSKSHKNSLFWHSKDSLRVHLSNYYCNIKLYDAIRTNKDDKVYHSFNELLKEFDETLIYLNLKNKLNFLKDEGLQFSTPSFKLDVIEEMFTNKKYYYDSFEEKNGDLLKTIEKSISILEEIRKMEYSFDEYPF